MSAKDIYSKQGQAVRKAARQLTDKQTELAVHNRLGLLVDGTGKDYNKISKLKSMLDSKGYECFLLAVNTDLETAIKRNRMRPRKLPDDKVKAMWMAVNDNMDKFKSLFKQNFMAVTNNDEDKPSVQSMKAYKKIGSWSKKAPASKLAQNWIKQALDARKTRREEVEDNLNEEVEIKEIYKGFEKVAVIKGKPNDIKKAKNHFDRVLDTLANFTGTDIKTHIDSIERYVDKLDRLIIRGTKAGGWAMDILKKNKKLKADYDFDLSSRKLGTSMMRMGEDINEKFESGEEYARE